MINLPEEVSMSDSKQAPLIGCNPMVLRQTPSSRFSHFSGSWGELLRLVNEHFYEATSANDEGTIVKVVLPSEGFFTSIVEVDPQTQLAASFGVRPRASEDEAPFIQVVATTGAKVPAKYVEVIMYDSAVLKDDECQHEDGRVEDSKWQIVRWLGPEHFARAHRADPRGAFVHLLAVGLRQLAEAAAVIKPCIEAWRQPSRRPQNLDGGLGHLGFEYACHSSLRTVLRFNH